MNANYGIDYDRIVRQIVDGKLLDKDEAMSWNRMPVISGLRAAVKPRDYLRLRTMVEAHTDAYPEVAALEINLMSARAKRPVQSKWLRKRWKNTQNEYVKSCLAWSLLDAAEHDPVLEAEVTEFLRSTKRSGIR